MTMHHQPNFYWIAFVQILCFIHVISHAWECFYRWFCSNSTWKKGPAWVTFNSYVSFQVCFFIYNVWYLIYIIKAATICCFVELVNYFLVGWAYFGVFIQGLANSNVSDGQGDQLVSQCSMSVEGVRCSS